MSGDRANAEARRAGWIAMARLLALVREAYADPTITTQYHPSEGDPERKRWRVWRDGCPIAYGVTEAGALISALERSAAPPVAPELVAVAPLVKA